MGAYRSPKARNQNVDTLTHEHLPKHLSEGEWIKYRTELPHRVAVRIADEAAMPVMGGKRNQQMVGLKIRSGSMGQIKLEEGIIDWHILDEENQPVPWRYDKRDELVEGLDPAVRRELLRRIDSASPPELGEVVDEETGETEGNDSGES